MHDDGRNKLHLFLMALTLEECVNLLDRTLALFLQIFLRQTLDDANLLCNCLGGCRLVSRDHDNLNTSAVALGDGGWNAGARRVNHRDAPQETQLALRNRGTTGRANREVVRILRLPLEIFGKIILAQLQTGETQNAFTHSGKSVIGLFELCLPLLGDPLARNGGHALGLASDHDVGAALEYLFGSSFHQQEWLARIRLPHNFQRELVLGAKRNAPRICRTFPVHGVVLSNLVHCAVFHHFPELEQAMIRCVSPNTLSIHDGLLHVFRRVLESSIIAEHNTLVSQLECSAIGFNLPTIEMILGKIEHLVAVDPHVRCSHLIHSESPSLVRANTRARSQGLHRLQVLHQNFFLLHSQGSQSQRHRHRGQQPLWHVRHDDTDREHQVRDEASHEISSRVDDHADDEESHTKNHCNHRNHQDEVVNFFVQGGLLRRLAGRQLCDMADHCVITNVHHNSNTVAIHCQCPEESDVHCFQRVLVGTIQTTGLLFRLTSQRRIINLEIGDGNHSDVGGNFLTLSSVHLHNIALAEINCIDLVFLHHTTNLSAHGALVGRHRSQCGHCI
mmetsp:Transcript_24792/g.54512  ORF Transcript_24792/g.54512 Transcript_24792/m.54512 type:complete len:561 (-) Transcript_24792:445-2127(-)